MPRTIASAGGNLPNGNFIPEMWSLKLQVKFYPQTVLNDIANHDWEGEIKGSGSKVNIRVTPTVNIGDYTNNQKIKYQDLDDDFIELPIDRSKYFAFKVSDIDQAQSDIKVINSATKDAAKNMATAIDTQVLGTVYASAGTSYTPTAITKTTVLDWIVDLNTELDQLNVSDDGRYIVLPPWACNAIKKSDLQDASLAGDQTSILRNGRVGMIDNTMIYKSNLLANDGTTWETICGTKDGISFASQFVKTETVRLQDSFGDAVRGLNVYGFEVTKPEALIRAPITKS